MNTQTKKELIIAAYQAPQGTRIQIFRNKKGEISWSNPQTNTWIANPENPRKEHPDTIGWIQALTLSELSEGIVERADGFGLDADVWSDWTDEFGAPVTGEYYEKEIVVPSLDVFLSAVTEFVDAFDFGFDPDDETRAEEKEEENDE